MTEINTTLDTVTVHSLKDATHPGAREAMVDFVFPTENPVVRSHAAIISEHQDGTHTFSTIDYDANREEQLKVSTRNIVKDHFAQMADDFSGLVNRIGGEE